MYDIPTDASLVNNTITHMDMAFYQTKASRDVFFECLLYSAKQYRVHPDYIYVLYRMEGGSTGKWSKNRDGSRDFGMMQINYEVWSKEFKRHGLNVNWNLVLHDMCSNVQAAAKIIQIRQKSSRYKLTALSNYHWFHSYKKNPKPHYVYKKKLKTRYARIVREKNQFVAKIRKLAGL